MFAVEVLEGGVLRSEERDEYMAGAWSSALTAQAGTSICDRVFPEIALERR